MQMNPSPTAIAQRPPTVEAPSMIPPSGDKKQQKRAANRRSAQLSRKRKKLFIEELKEENDELRRKEQILMSIPDLIVVFDSAGKLWFVSHSVGRFLDFMPEELEGSSFWDRLCEESVRLLKAAFMDALAARQNDMDTAPLGSGVWELRLVDKDGSHKVITLNGVVHFSGDAPECVCSIRPRDEKNPSVAIARQAPPIAKALATAQADAMSISTAIKPQQSVIAGGSSSNSSTSSGPTQADDGVSVRLARGKVQVNPPAVGSSGRRAAQISDGDSGSVVSESGSEELLA
jgi:PAS domain S-box-containing protein